MKRLFLTLAIIGLTAAAQLLWSAPQQNDIPHYNPAPPAKGQVLPAILTDKQLAAAALTAPVQIVSYKAAAKKPALLHQLPCYCHCDKGFGHNSLHSCFENTHGANCGVCMAEALYAYKMSKQGWTAKMVRDGIIRGEYKQMDLMHPDPVN